jgi:methylmalonyl-CoA/ethylmalonyl-CoA epimerase
MPVIHHIGWAVRSIDASRVHFETALGLDLKSDEVFPNLRVAFFDGGSASMPSPLGERSGEGEHSSFMIELLQPLTDDSDVARFLARRGEGLHHLALRVDDVAAALAEAESRGLQPIDSAPRRGARGTLVGMVDPRREDGVLVQYVQEVT